MNKDNIVKQITSLHKQAYQIYKPQVDGICNCDASEADVAHLLDHIFDFCGDEKILNLFKQICRKYYKKYPELIAYQINAYREYYDNDEEVVDDQL